MSNANQKVEESNLETKVKEVLSNLIGTEPDDIVLDDSLREDLHMSATNLVDFLKALEQEGVVTSKVDLTEIKTVSDLLDALDKDSLIE